MAFATPSMTRGQPVGRVDRASMVPLLLVTGVSAWLELVHVLAAMSLTGIGTGAALAAGLASAQALLVFGAVVSLLTALIAAGTATGGVRRRAVAVPAPAPVPGFRAGDSGTGTGTGTGTG